jgi:hypothetical protein
MSRLQYVNVGARLRGVRITTKKALREALANDPSAVEFDRTDGGLGRYVSGDAVPSGIALSVCGPDPYHDRRWYATVVSSTDKVIVS